MQPNTNSITTIRPENKLRGKDGGGRGLGGGQRKRIRKGKSKREQSLVGKNEGANNFRGKAVI